MHPCLRFYCRSDVSLQITASSRLPALTPFSAAYWNFEQLSFAVISNFIEGLQQKKHIYRRQKNTYIRQRNEQYLHIYIFFLESVL